jgi:hypothetical protein
VSAKRSTKEQTILGSARVHNPLLGWGHGDGSRHALLRDYVTMLMAGGEAQRLAGFGQETCGDSSDIEAALHWMSTVPRSSSRGGRGGFVGDDFDDRYIEARRAEARKVLRQRWSQVQTVAEALLREKVLNAPEVEKLLAGCGHPSVASTSRFDWTSSRVEGSALNAAHRWRGTRRPRPRGRPSRVTRPLSRSSSRTCHPSAPQRSGRRSATSPKRGDTLAVATACERFK